MFLRRISVLILRNLKIAESLSGKKPVGVVRLFCSSRNEPKLNVEAVFPHYVKHSEVIEKINSRSPDFCTSSNNKKLEEFIQVFKNYDFTESDCFQILSSDPDLLKVTHVQLNETLLCWHNTNLGNELIKFLIVNNSAFLYVPVQLVEKRLPLLQGFVKKPQKLVLTLLRSPNLLTEQWDQIENKINYLTNVMRVEKDEILNSNALGKSLEHIKLRHQILEKCGLYEAASPYEHKRIKNEKSAFRNPHLKRIVDNKDISFARKICKISIEEYEAFKELLIADQDAYSEEEIYSGSDSDSDDDKKSFSKRR